jgi:hypothetical protein
LASRGKVTFTSQSRSYPARKEVREEFGDEREDGKKGKEEGRELMDWQEGGKVKGRKLMYLILASCADVGILGRVLREEGRARRGKIRISFKSYPS